jgi:hypothetical protein
MANRFQKGEEMKSWGSGALTAAALLFSMQASEAATFSFTGTVDDPAALGSQFHAGDTMELRLTIDLSQTGTVLFGSTFYSADQLFGKFNNGYAFSLQPSARVQPSSGTVTFGGSPIAGASVGAYDFAGADFYIYAPISSGSLPNFVNLFPLNTSTAFYLHFQGPTVLGDTHVNGHLTGVKDFTAATTPVPATLPLFISALAGLGFVAWHRKKAAATA